VFLVGYRLCFVFVCIHVYDDAFTWLNNKRTNTAIIYCNTRRCKLLAYYNRRVNSDYPVQTVTEITVKSKHMEQKVTISVQWLTFYCKKKLKTCLFLFFYQIKYRYRI